MLFIKKPLKNILECKQKWNPELIIFIGTVFGLSSRVSQSMNMNRKELNMQSANITLSVKIDYNYFDIKFNTPMDLDEFYVI